MAAVEAHRNTSTRKRSRRGVAERLRKAPAGLSTRWHTVREKFTWWEITLFVVGVVASCSVLGALFFAVGDKPARIYADAAVPAVDSMEFSTALSNLVGAPVDRGGTVSVLNNGDEFLPALL